MLAILAPILVFGLVIFVHEFGHFLAAKAVGVYAPRFSIGFGPSIFKFRRGETEYILAWLPLGGYVRMASRHDAETAFLEGGNEEQTTRPESDPDYDPNAMIPFGPKPVPENRWFESKPLWARIVIMLAGVCMNALLAIVVGTVLAIHYGQLTLPTTVVGRAGVSPGAPELSQLHLGDSIRSINGHRVHSWNEVRRQIASSDGAVHFVTQHGAVDVPLGRAGTTAQDVADSVQYFLPAVIDSIFAGDPAARAGIQRGDSIVSVAGAPIHTWTDMVDHVVTSPNRALAFVIRRGGVTESLTVTPKAVRDTNPETGAEIVLGKIGAGPRDPSIKSPVGLVAGIGAGLRITWSNAGAVYQVLHHIGVGQVSVRQLAGPVAIARASVTAARNGIDELFYLIALLSINVAVLNLLPIPILDGGQILINVLEAAKGSPFSLRTREYILRFGLLAIALLFAIVMYNDTRAGLARMFGWLGHLFGA